MGDMLTTSGMMDIVRGGVVLNSLSIDNAHAESPLSFYRMNAYTKSSVF